MALSTGNQSGSIGNGIALLRKATGWGLVTLGMGCGAFISEVQPNYAQSFSGVSQLKPVIIAQQETPQLYTTVSIDELNTVINKAGFSTRKESDRVLRFDGGSYKMFASLESCEDNDPNRCRVVVLGTFFKSSPANTVINEWNKTRYGSTAYLDKDNDATLEASITLVGGITADNFTAHILLFAARVDQFSKYIGFSN